MNMEIGSLFRGGAWDSAFVTSSSVMLTLLTVGHSLSSKNLESLA